MRTQLAGQTHHSTLFFRPVGLVPTASSLGGGRASRALLLCPPALKSRSLEIHASRCARVAPARAGWGGVTSVCVSSSFLPYSSPPSHGAVLLGAEAARARPQWHDQALLTPCRGAEARC